MNWKRRIPCLILPALVLGVLWSCVTQEKYLMKVEESEKLSSELMALRSEYARLERERNDLEREKNDLEKARTEAQLKNVSFEQEIARLKQDNTKLEEILQAKSDTLSKQISDLRKQNRLLKEEKDALQSKTLALEVQRKEEFLEMKITYQDLLRDMKSEIEKGKITITQLEGKLKVNMMGEILFDSGRTTIKPQGVKVLERVGKALLDVSDQAINVEGHTDNVPISAELKKWYPTNWELSVARASAVARYLQEKIGVDPSSISATGYGQYKPIASNKTKEGRAKNRRIEIVLVPKEIAPSSKE